MGSIWVIAEPVVISYRPRIDGGVLPRFAHFDARLLPHDIEAGVAVFTAWQDPEDDVWLPAIRAGVSRFVEYRNKSSQPVARTALEMTRMITHPVDTFDDVVSGNVCSALHR